MLDWKSLPPEGHTKKLLYIIGFYWDDYDDAATMIDAAYEKYCQINSTLDTTRLTPFDWYCFVAFLKDKLTTGNIGLFGELLERLFSEAFSENLALQSLGMEQKISGRPNSMTEQKILQIIGMVKFELKNTTNKSKAYEVVAKSLNKFPDTVRRYYERWVVQKSNGKKEIFIPLH
ncbi:hypothetical protein [Bacterioplanoides pacificum]|uniref:Uncharacterized protein n=1 Tax=Bacterioplanoides pacificum TaxID=1171596 RepID=A0ABV7VPR4_9GAMM